MDLQKVKTLLSEARHASESPYLVRYYIDKIVTELENENENICEWETDEDGLSETSCGLLWECINGTPKENNMNYCPKCGSKIVEVSR